MYSGRLMDDLMQMVARAEEHAKELKAEPVEPKPYVFYTSRYIYEAAAQTAYAGVA
jgi:hypothetical protein